MRILVRHLKAITRAHLSQTEINAFSSLFFFVLKSKIFISDQTLRFVVASNSMNSRGAFIWRIKIDFLVGFLLFTYTFYVYYTSATASSLSQLLRVGLFSNYVFQFYSDKWRKRCPEHSIVLCPTKVAVLSIWAHPI